MTNIILFVVDLSEVSGQCLELISLLGTLFSQIFDDFLSNDSDDSDNSNCISHNSVLSLLGFG